MIVVTGASRGLGHAIAQRLLSNNIEVVGLARNVEHLDFENFACDVSSYKETQEVVQKLRKKKRSIRGLINAAGIASMNLALTTPEKTTQKIIDVNLAGTIFCCQLFSPLMIRKKEGVIINFSTIAVPLALRGESVYIASKAGIEGFTRSFAREVSDFNIRVNCIAPGPISTDLIKGVSDNQIRKIIDQQIIRKKYSPKEVCDLVEILLDEKTSSLSGQVLSIGGY